MDDCDYYILKFGDSNRSSAELEMTYYKMATEAGIDMMPSRLLETDGERHFLTQRFDRMGGEKQHLQTLAAMDPDADSYEKLLLVCRRLHLPDSSADEVFRRMVFNYLANNTDDHNKNFSFIMNREGVWRLSPAYDMTFIFNSGGYQPEMEHCLLMQGKYKRWTKDNVLHFAEKYGVNEPMKIIRRVAGTLAQFRKLAEQNNVKSEWIGRIETTINKHLQEWGFATMHRAEEWTTDDGRHVTDIYLEQAYKGNIHLYATIDGKQKRYVFRLASAEYKHIAAQGINNVTCRLLHELVELYLL